MLPGDVLTWTITVVNTSTVAFSGALFTDDLSNTVAGVALAGAPDFISSNPSVATTWSAGTSVLSGTATNLTRGASVTVTYSGTVKSRAVLSAGGVTTIDNTVVPADVMTNCTTTPGCDTTNPVAPHLTLVKDVVNGSTGTASSPDWTLTATGGGASPINGPGITNTTGPNADVTSRTTYTLTESPTDAASTVTDGYTTNGVWSCVNANAASTMTTTTASVTPADGADITCTITNTYQPVATATKGVSRTVENADGSWTITYHLVITDPDSRPAGDVQPVRHPGLRHRHHHHRRGGHPAGRDRRPGVGRFGHRHPRHRPPVGRRCHRDVDGRADRHRRQRRVARRHVVRLAGHAGLRLLQLGHHHHLVGPAGHVGVL